MDTHRRARTLFRGPLQLTEMRESHIGTITIRYNTHGRELTESRESHNGTITDYYSQKQENPIMGPLRFVERRGPSLGTITGHMQW